MRPGANDRQKYYNIMSLADTAKLAPVLGIDYVVKNLAPSTYSHDRMITSFPSAIQNISSIVLATSKETLQTYFMWKAINELVPTVRAPEIEPLRILGNTLSGRVWPI